MVSSAFDRSGAGGPWPFPGLHASPSAEMPAPREPEALGSSGDAAARDGRRTLGSTGGSTLGARWKFGTQIWNPYDTYKQQGTTYSANFRDIQRDSGCSRFLSSQV